MLLTLRGFVAASQAEVDRHGSWPAAPPGGAGRLDAPPRRATTDRAGQDEPVWFTTLPGALSAMALAAVPSLITSLAWLVAPASSFSAFDGFAVVLEQTALFGSLVNLVAVVTGCWSEVPWLRRVPPTRRR